MIWIEYGLPKRGSHKLGINRSKEFFESNNTVSRLNSTVTVDRLICE